MSIRCITGSCSFSSHRSMAHPPRPGLWSPPHRHHSPSLPSVTPTLEPQSSISKWPLEMNSKNSSLITLPLLSRKHEYSLCGSLLLLIPLKAAKASIPFGRLAYPLRHGGVKKQSWHGGVKKLWEIDGGHALRRIVPRLIASHMLRCHKEHP